MFNIGPVELILLLAIGLVFLGPEKFPEVVKIAMRAYRDLRGYVNDVKRDLSDELNPIKKEMRELSNYNPEDYVEKLTSAIMSDEPEKPKDAEAAAAHENSGANGSVAYQAAKTDEAPKSEAPTEEEYPD